MTTVLTPDDETVRRLALVRELYLRAVETSLAPEPVGSLAILGLHDAVEMFLHLVATRLNVPQAGSLEFMAYWDEISSRLPGSPLGGKASMRQLNQARVGLKHHGNLAAQLSLEGHRAATTSFLESSTLAIFGLTLGEIDMLDLVAFSSTRQHIESADASVASGDVSSALGNLAIAFAHLLEEFHARDGTPPFGGWSSVSAPTVLVRAGAMDEVNGAFVELADEVDLEVRRLERAIEFVALGVDLRRWQRFELWTPRLSRKSGKWVAIDQGKVEALALDEENVRFCRDFVIGSALRLQGQ